MKKLLFLLIAVCSVVMVASAANRTVTGQVLSADNNEPLMGATVMPAGGGNGTATDMDGNFVLSIPESVKQITVSYVGMVTKTVTAKDNMKIVLENADTQLDDVVVVAYGTTKKESFTGSAAVIKSDKLSTRPVANVTKALDGQVSGVQTTSGSGQPGSGVSVVIRGFGSMNASSNPLYVVDGVPYDGAISSINPNDIESMTVLKDASAGALYGARGANGVVMITTKRGKEGKPTVHLKANWGWATRSLPRYETMNEAGYLETVFQSYKNKNILENGLSPQDAAVQALQDMRSGSTKVLGDNEQYNPFNYSITELIDPVTGKVRSDAQLKYHEDWMDELTTTPLRQEYEATVSGGSAKNKYMFSLGYLDEDGLLKTTNFKRYSGRMNIDSKITDWFGAGMNATYARRESNTQPENSSANSNAWYSAQLMGPIFPVYEKDENGQTILDNLGQKVFDYGINRPAGANSKWNTVATLFDDRYSSNSDNFSGRFYATVGDWQTGALKGLKFTFNYGCDLINGSSMTYYNPYNGNQAAAGGMLAKATERTFSYTANELLNYKRGFGNHNIDFLVGHEFYKYNYQYLSGTKSGFPFGGLYELDAASTLKGASSYEHNYSIESVLSRFNYDYLGRYYFSASLRTDGSSRFNKDSRWGTFWSVGANWRISEEAFMKQYTWLNNLSLRASYGVQGNDNLGTYYAWQSFYDLVPNAGMSGATLSSLENTDLKWEKNKNFNVALEGRVLDRINFTLEYYNRKTSDMLMSYPMASSLGFDGYNKNIGEMRNLGFEFSLRGELVKTQDIYWALQVMGSTVSNKVLKLADKPEIISGARIIKEGEAINSFYTASAAGVDPATGAQLYWAWDLDNNGNPGERYITSDQSKANKCKSIQGSRIPDLYGSVSTELRIKNFDFSTMFTYSFGGKVLDGVYSSLRMPGFIGNAMSADLERAWKQPGDITDIPRIEVGKTYITTDNDLIDASYFAMKNVTMGYTLPKSWTKSAQLQAVRFTASADNLFILTHLKGMDPQYNFSGSTSFGYTPTRTVTFGVDVTF